ncbi:MAG: DUF1525 domain-containing protein [Gammaproteobacteria bacterium]|nr:DUF1525 domain-containing protein [Gammaproteobacteria bacterium]
MRQVIVIISITILSCLQVGFAETIEVFTVQAIPVSDHHVQAKICVLDKAKGIEQAINQSLQSQSDTDRTTLRQLYGQQFQLLSDQKVCRFRAASLGVKFLPAVVVNGQYVMYGNPDIASSLAAYHTYREAHPHV